MHLYKILLAFTLLIVSTVAQLQFSQFPPPSVRVGQPVTVTWIGGNGGVCACPRLLAYVSMILMTILLACDHHIEEGAK